MQNLEYREFKFITIWVELIISILQINSCARTKEKDVVLNLIKYAGRYNKIVSD